MLYSLAFALINDSNQYVTQFIEVVVVCLLFAAAGRAFKWLNRKQ